MTHNKKKQIPVIRCDICYAAFVGDKAMKHYTKHHNKRHPKEQSMFTQIYLQKSNRGVLDFNTMEVKAG